MNRNHALLDHLSRVEAENAVERFADVPPGTFRRVYAGIGRPMNQLGWVRLWAFSLNGVVVAHASVIDVGLGEVVNGHISIERDHRGNDIAKRLQAVRFAFLDAHQLTLLGPIEVGNDASWFGCRRAGFEFSHYDPVKRQVWVHRLPSSDTLASNG